MTARSYSWRGVDDPGRIDHARVHFSSDGMRAFGTATAPDFATVWQLDVDRQWVTSQLRVTARGWGWSRSLVLARSEHGVWTAEASADGDDSGLAEPGLADPASVAGALDCDLGLCPVTNTMPILRLGLLGVAASPTTLTMAWVDVPSLQVIRGDQVYSSSGHGGRVDYESAERDFHAALTVDDDGVVVDYPGLATRIDGPA